MAEKKATIVIKKITVVSGGAHGGAWKVAFADFMTAMMAFFLVMWLIASSSDQTKKNVSDYFSTPSVIEYNFSNYGVELTLEKLFLDLINDPLKALDDFVKPMQKTPNILSLGMKKIAMGFIADQLGEIAENVEVLSDSAVFEISDEFLFEIGTAKPKAKFGEVMAKLKGVMAGIDDATLDVASVVYFESVSDPLRAKPVATERLDLIQSRVDAMIQAQEVEVHGRAISRSRKPGESKKAGGYLRFEIKQKERTASGQKSRPLVDEAFGSKEKKSNVYDNFVNQVSSHKKNAGKPGSLQK